MGSRPEVGGSDAMPQQPLEESFLVLGLDREDERRRAFWEVSEGLRHEVAELLEEQQEVCTAASRDGRLRDAREQGPDDRRRRAIRILEREALSGRLVRKGTP